MSDELVPVWNGAMDRLGACFALSGFIGNSSIYQADKRAQKEVEPAMMGHEERVRKNRVAYDERVAKMKPDARAALARKREITALWKQANRQRVREYGRRKYREKKGGVVRNYTFRFEE